MAKSLGKVDLREIAPSHPFAHTSIIFGLPHPRKHKPPLPMGRRGVTVSVVWGYDLHSVRIGAARWRRIRRGEAVLVRSSYWYEGERFSCWWFFDEHAEHSLVVDYGEDGGTGFTGDIREATIEER